MTSVATGSTYRVETLQEGDWWVTRVVGLDANYTQAGTFEEVEGMARNLIALVLDIDEAAVGTIHVMRETGARCPESLVRCDGGPRYRALRNEGVVR